MLLGSALLASSNHGVSKRRDEDGPTAFKVQMLQELSAATLRMCSGSFYSLFRCSLMQCRSWARSGRTSLSKEDFERRIVGSSWNLLWRV